MFSELSDSIRQILTISIPAERKVVLQELIEYLKDKVKAGTEINLNFICTHNSRRSQFAQIWAQTAADYHGINVNCFSGGVEETAFNQNAVDAIKRAGFKISKIGTENPIYSILHSDTGRSVRAFSKLYDHPDNPASGFAAVMTCSDADENCPFIPGTEKRIALLYEDPKVFDDSPDVAEKYDERSNQIASEMFYVFSFIKSNRSY
ncbi:MAG: protein-tyrosine-phosphatase [Bacteroidota bacterium]